MIPTPSTLEVMLFGFLCQKYVQRADDRQKAMGLLYTEAETHDLARELSLWFQMLTEKGLSP
jgi:hypothetical protein